MNSTRQYIKIVHYNPPSWKMGMNYSHDYGIYTKRWIDYFKVTIKEVVTSKISLLTSSNGLATKFQLKQRIKGAI